MSQMRRVSVVIGTRNRPDTLREALASIRALEGPDLTFEILVGDNGDDASTPDVVAEFGGHYSRTETYGCPAARNLALARVTGEFIAFLDDDDLWLPGHIRPHIALLDASPELGAVFGQIQSADNALHPIGPPWPTALDRDVFRAMLSGYFPQVGGTVVRASLLPELGLMDEALIGDSDWDWQLRITRRWPVGFVSKPCVLFRQRPKGSFDALQQRRAGYTRKIFWRHALAEPRRWSSRRDMLRDYFRSVQQYYEYFIDAAIERAEGGDRRGALKALLGAARIIPHRVAKALLHSTPIRRAVLSAAFSRQPGKLDAEPPSRMN